MIKTEGSLTSGTDRYPGGEVQLCCIEVSIKSLRKTFHVWLWIGDVFIGAECCHCNIACNVTICEPTHVMLSTVLCNHGYNYTHSIM